jgi:GTP-binding protein HflX
MSSPRHSTSRPGPPAVLVGIQTPGLSLSDVHASLDELARLAKTLGLRPIARLTQARPGTGAVTVLGEGKLRALAELTGGTGVVPSGAERRQTGSRPGGRAKGASAGDEVALAEAVADDGEDLGEGLEVAAAAAAAAPAADAATAEVGGEIDAGAAGSERAEEAPAAPGELATVVLFDHDLTPSQLRAVEAATEAEVLDRSSVILSIFQRHARTREAQLQVEIARLTYLAPRLRAAGAGQDRQRGGIGGKGAGESAIELDRRRVRDRIAELERELVVVRREADTRRARRGQTDTVALVGYTNAGKSSLMRALTGSEIYVADQLFATLDTTVRVLQPETRPRILVSDTVGFIKKLPHDLVASFRSTLEEARDAALLLHVVDASDPAWRAQLAVTREVLAEIGATESPSLLLLNKVDRLSEEQALALAAELPEAIQLSAKRPEDVARLHASIVAFFERTMVEAELVVPYTRQRLVHEIHESCRVLAETHEEAGTRLRVRAPGGVLERLRAEL